MSVYYNDIEHFPCEVLRKQIKLGNLPEGHVDERDIRAITAADLVGYNHVHLFAGIGGFPLGFEWARVPKSIRILTGGFPCQDVSNAGKRAGITGERSGLWSQQYRLIQEAIDSGMGFDYVVVENVAALVNRGLSTVLGDLAQAGYDAEWRVLRASDFGAPHQRERIFIVAYPSSQRRQQITTSAHGNESANEGRTPQHHHQSTSDGQGNGSTIVENTNELGESWAPLNIPTGQRSPSEPASLRQWEDRAQMAHPSIQRLQECGFSRLTTTTTQARAGMEPELERCSANVADASSSGQQERDATTITGEPGHPAWRKIAPGRTLVESSTSGRERQYHGAGRSQGSQPLTQQSSQREPECGICRVFDGLPYRLDRSLWPAGPGQEQYDWEPARTITERQPQRVARLKALGNGIVPQITEYIGYTIINHYQYTQQREHDSASLDYTNNTSNSTNIVDRGGVKL